MRVLDAAADFNRDPVTDLNCKAHYFQSCGGGKR
jgi:hypothetical protein